MNFFFFYQKSGVKLEGSFDEYNTIFLILGYRNITVSKNTSSWKQDMKLFRKYKGIPNSALSNSLPWKVLSSSAVSFSHFCTEKYLGVYENGGAKKDWIPCKVRHDQLLLKRHKTNRVESLSKKFTFLTYKATMWSLISKLWYDQLDNGIFI